MELKNLGITTAKINQFNSKGIYTVEDLVEFFPRKYLDFRRPVSLYQALDGELVSVVIDIYDITNDGRMLKIRGKDINGKHIFISYFGQLYIEKQLSIGDRVIFCGKIQVGYNGLVSMTNPVAFSKNIESLQRIMPIYPKIKGMSEEYFNKTLAQALESINKTDYLMNKIKEKFELMDYSEALREIHNPTNPQTLSEARKRFLFDDLLFYNYQLVRNASVDFRESNKIFKKIELRDSYIKNLPFELTQGQINAIDGCHNKILEGNRLNALVQGDVGCGKTEIAKTLLIEAYENGYQGVLLAPTTVLAKQHFEDLSKSFKDFNLNIEFLNGDIKTKDRKELLEKLKNKEIDILVGTHAVFSDDVEYNNLGIIIVDEEHKFGVAQKEKLRAKAINGVHYISLSATPIPRTLASTLYGDSVEIFTVNNRPLGRLPIKTSIIKDIKMIYKAIEQITSMGQQSYIICPLIDAGEDEKEYSIETIYNEALANLGNKGIKIGMINGRMKEDEINTEINKFLNKEYDVLVSTTIVEVGVNIENATFIAIMGAERFGLSQLHQLRGRVGRNKLQSYCVLYPSVNLEEQKYTNAKNKLEIMTRTNNGFTIAEEDLKFRGPGDLIGTSQTGDNKYILEMLANQELNSRIHKLCEKIVQNEKIKEHFDNYLINNKEKETM